MDIISAFGERLKELINENGLTVNNLSEEINVKPSNISHYLNKRSLPTLDVLVKLADFFSCSADYLLGREEYKPLSFASCPAFCGRLEFLRGYFGLNACEFYTKAGITKSRYYEWKNGARKPSVDNLIKIADAYDCRVDFVLGREK